MKDKIALSDQFEERLIEFAARIIRLAGRLPKNFQGRHVASQILRSGTAAAPNYAEARGAESRADFIHKMRIVQKELNETAVWIRIIGKSSLLQRQSGRPAHLQVRRTPTRILAKSTTFLSDEN